MPTTIRTSGADRSSRVQIAVVARTTATRETRVTTRSTPGLWPYGPFQDDDPACRPHQRLVVGAHQGEPTTDEQVHDQVAGHRFQGTPLACLLRTRFALARVQRDRVGDPPTAD